MDAKWKQKWVGALRGGKYVQARRQLRTDDAFCCLGVLCDIGGVEWDGCVASYKGEARAGLPPPPLARRVGLYSDVANKLASMNDCGSSFTEIADFIEREL